MDGFACEECRAIYRDLRANARAAREQVAQRPGGLAAWLEQLSEEDCARLRESAGLWKAWRRLQEHRALTGHSLSQLAIPPGAIVNAN